MAYKYLFELNGEELKNVAIGASVHEKFEEPLDEGGLHLPLTIRNIEYEMRGFLDITMVDDDAQELKFQFLILYDNVEEASKYGEWKHNLVVGEYAKKHDDSLLHSIARTKTIKSDVQAPFEIILGNQFIAPISGTANQALIRAYLQPIKVYDTYFSNRPLKFKQVYQAFELEETTPFSDSDFVRRPAIIRVVGHGTTQTLSTGDVEFDLDNGNYVIEYGFLSSLDLEVWIWRFYVKVIDEVEVSVLDIVNLVRDSVSKFGGVESKLYFDETRLFNIDPGIEDYLASVEVPQTYIQKATTRQVLNSLFLYINSISRFERDKVNNIDILKIREFNNIVGSFTKSDIASYTSSQEATELANTGVSWLERALPSNLEEPTVISPGQDFYKTVRSKDIQIRQDNFVLPLEEELYQAKRLTYLQPSITWYYTAFTDNITYTNLKIDLTPRFINREEWLLKLINVNFPTIVTQEFFSSALGLRQNRENNLYWQQGDTEINFSLVFGEAFQSNLIDNVITEAVYEHFMLNMPTPFVFFDLGTMTQRIHNTVTLQGSIPNFRDMKFNIEYITEENLNILNEREYIGDNPYHTEARINQSDKLVNIARASRRSYGDLQRVGVPTIKFSKYHYKLNTLYELGMQDSEGFVVVERMLELHNNYIKANYVVTRDHNRLSRFIGLDQLYRAFEIPTSRQIFEKIESYRDYIIVSNPSEPITSELSKIHANSLKLVFGTLKNDWGATDGKTKVTLAYVITDGLKEIYPTEFSERYGVMTRVGSFGIKNGFNFTFGFRNNQIAGDGVEKSTGSSLYWNKFVRYTNEQGRFREFWFQLSNKFSNDSYDSYSDEQRMNNYPLTRTTNPYFGEVDDVMFNCGRVNETLEDYDPLIIEKDSSQNIKVSYQNSVISKNYLEYVFGQSFFTENFIVKNPLIEYNELKGTPKFLYIYNNGTKYGKFEDLKVKSGWESKVELTNSNAILTVSTEDKNGSLLFSGISLSSATSWAIGDDDGNLYVACNNNHNGLVFGTKHFRPGIREIGTY